MPDETGRKQDAEAGVDALRRAPLPLRDGVAPSRQWLPAGPWPTLADFLRERFPNIPASVWFSRLARGQVVDETGARLEADSPYRPGACIYYYRELTEELEIPFQERVLYADEHLLVVDKPHFLPVQPAGKWLRESLLARLRRSGQPEELVPLQRLDRETAGLVFFSRNPATRGLYAALWQQRQVIKEYEAVAPAWDGSTGPVLRRSRIVRGEPFYRMKEVAGAPNAETRIELLETRQDGFALYRARAMTGRKHQIRLHFCALGRPLLNDQLYPEVQRAAPGDFSQPLQLLARAVSFPDPLTGAVRAFTSELSLTGRAICP